jgi:hypothetical protein
MIPDGLPVSQFFEGATPDTPPALFVAPIMLALLFLSLIDVVAGAAALFRRRADRR